MFLFFCGEVSPPLVPAETIAPCCAQVLYKIDRKIISCTKILFIFLNINLKKIYTEDFLFHDIFARENKVDALIIRVFYMQQKNAQMLRES